MAVFLSYAHEDAERVDDLRRDLEDLVGQVWLDRSLTGGQLWWDEILVQLRGCRLVVLAVSQDSLRSEACLAEVSYAVALQRPLLAVHIDESDLSAAPEHVRRTHVVDFRTRNPDSVKALAKAVFSIGDAGPLPAVLPEIPPIPRSYRDRFADLFRPDMTLDEQVSLFALLKFDIENGTNQHARRRSSCAECTTVQTCRGRSDRALTPSSRARRRPLLLPHRRSVLRPATRTRGAHPDRLMPHERAVRKSPGRKRRMRVRPVRHNSRHTFRRGVPQF